MLEEAHFFPYAFHNKAGWSQWLYCEKRENLRLQAGIGEVQYFVSEMSECGFSKQILYFPTTHLPQRSLRTLGFLSIFDKNLFATLASLAVSIQDVISETALGGPKLGASSCPSWMSYKE